MDTVTTCDAHQHNWVNGVCTREGCTHDHAASDWVRQDDTKTEANCKYPASYVYKCKVCGDTETRSEGGVAEGKHNWVNGVCQTCGDGCTHDWEETNRTEATCVKPAHVWSKCDICKATKDEDVGTKDETKHNFYNGSCANTGCDQACDHSWSNGVCSKCTYPCGHASTTQTTTVEPTCKKAGSANVTCNECGVVTETVAVEDPDAHAWTTLGPGRVCTICGDMEVTGFQPDEDEEDDEPIENPCEEHEWFALSFGGWYCYKCGATATDLDPLEPDACDHADTYIEVVTPATCRKTGVAKKICDICEEVREENVELPVDPDAHAWTTLGPGRVCTICTKMEVTGFQPEEPEDTCDHNWEQVTNSGWVCTKCGDMTNDEPVVTPPVVEPDDSEENDCEHEWELIFSFGSWYCPKCGDMTVENPTDEPDPEPDLKDPDPNCDHNWSQVTNSGWVCTKCGGMTTDEPSTPDEPAPDDPTKPDEPICNHEETYPVKVDSDCTNAGYIDYYCADCGELVKSEPLAVDPDAHEYVDGVCTICGAAEPTEPDDPIKPDDPTPSEPTKPQEPVVTPTPAPVVPAITLEYYYNNTMTSYGPMTRELVGGDDWYRVTPVDLSVDGVYTYDLVASNRYVVGTVTIKVEAGVLTVNYDVKARPCTVKEEELKIYASKADLAAGNAVEAKIGEGISFDNDTKVIVSLILTGDYAINGHYVTDLVINDAEIVAMIANMD